MGDQAQIYTPKLARGLHERGQTNWFIPTKEAQTRASLQTEVHPSPAHRDSLMPMKLFRKLGINFLGPNRIFSRRTIYRSAAPSPASASWPRHHPTHVCVILGWALVLGPTVPRKEFRVRSLPPEVNSPTCKNPKTKPSKHPTSLPMWAFILLSMWDHFLLRMFRFSRMSHVSRISRSPVFECLVFPGCSFPTWQIASFSLNITFPVMST